MKGTKRGLRSTTMLNRFHVRVFQIIHPRERAEKHKPVRGQREIGGLWTEKTQLVNGTGGLRCVIREWLTQVKKKVKVAGVRWIKGNKKNIKSQGGAHSGC